MRVALIVDAGQAIGFGHLSRSLTLAHALRGRRAAVTLFAPPLPASWTARLVESGVTYESLPESLHTDQGNADPLLESGQFTHVIIDHYGVPPEVLAQLVQGAPVVWRLEDHGRGSVAGERVLCPIPAVGAHEASSRQGSLYGPRYALIEPDYRRARAEVRPRERCARLLVSCGGSDPVNLTQRALDGIVSTQLALAVDVVIGPAYAWRAELMRSPAARDPRLTFHDAPSGLVALLSASDLAFGAPGHTSWERACLGVPSLLALQADNQTGLAAFLAERGAARVLGRAEHVTPAAIAAALEDLCADPGALSEMSTRASALVDGAGAERVADALQGLTVRRATADDARLLFEWANEPRARALSLSSAPIPWDVHVRWLTGVLASSERVLLIGELAGAPIGQCRLDGPERGRTVSVSLDAARRGAGLARPFLAAALREHAGDAQLVALIKPENEASLALFRGLGFTDDGVSSEGALRLCCPRFLG